MNKKEEVIDIELTPYGKRLLSMGKMKPAYYAFFDDNIMYDAAYAGIEESQNIIQDRITELTPQLQTQYKFTSKGKEGIAVDFGNGETVSTIAPLEKNALSQPLGNSRMSGENYPAINIRMLSGNIKDYDLDLNSKFFSKEGGSIKLTEKEIEIILYLNSNKIKHNVLDLQKNIWKYSSDLETHTVETHIYRLRKKILNTFSDNEFIVSKKNGYQIKQEKSNS